MERPEHAPAMTCCVAETAEGGFASVATALTFRPGVVLMDLAMKRMDGYETVRPNPAPSRVIMNRYCVVCGIRPPFGSPAFE